MLETSSLSVLRLLLPVLMLRYYTVTRSGSFFFVKKEKLDLNPTTWCGVVCCGLAACLDVGTVTMLKVGCDDMSQMHHRMCRCLRTYIGLGRCLTAYKIIPFFRSGENLITKKRKR
jgi:hypothetical protein